MTCIGFVHFQVQDRVVPPSEDKIEASEEVEGSPSKKLKIDREEKPQRSTKAKVINDCRVKILFSGLTIIFPLLHSILKG